MLIPLAEYAKAHGRAERSARQMAERGGFRTAQKVGRNWIIENDEPYPADRRKKENKQNTKESKGEQK